jgi:hypothetical protein
MTRPPADFRSWFTGLVMGIALGAGFVVSFFVFK